MATAGGTSSWIGLSDFVKEGTWQDTNGQGIGLYKPWAPGEPNGGRKENCVTQYSASAGTSKQWKWNDNNCDLGFRFVCQTRLGESEAAKRQRHVPMHVQPSATCLCTCLCTLPTCTYDVWRARPAGVACEALEGWAFWPSVPIPSTLPTRPRSVTRGVVCALVCVIHPLAFHLLACSLRLAPACIYARRVFTQGLAG